MRKTIGLLSAAVIAGFATTAMAETHTDPVPQDNRCWGESASGLAHIEAGAMGQHSRSQKAPGDSFADNFGGGTILTEPRQGVGNVSRGAPHNTEPGDGGNGQHAVNNGTSDGFSGLIDPVTGLPASGDPDRIPLGEDGCSTGLQQNVLP